MENSTPPRSRRNSYSSIQTSNEIIDVESHESDSLQPSTPQQVPAPPTTSWVSSMLAGHRHILPPSNTIQHPPVDYSRFITNGRRRALEKFSQTTDELGLNITISQLKSTKKLAYAASDTDRIRPILQPSDNERRSIKTANRVAKVKSAVATPGTTETRNQMGVWTADEAVEAENTLGGMPSDEANDFDLDFTALPTTTDIVGGLQGISNNTVKAYAAIRDLIQFTSLIKYTLTLAETPANMHKVDDYLTEFNKRIKTLVKELRIPLGTLKDRITNIGMIATHAGDFRDGIIQPITRILTDIQEIIGEFTEAGALGMGELIPIVSLIPAAFDIGQSVIDVKVRKEEAKEFNNIAKAIQDTNLEDVSQPLKAAFRALEFNGKLRRGISNREKDLAILRGVKGGISAVLSLFTIAELPFTGGAVSAGVKAGLGAAATTKSVLSSLKSMVYLGSVTGKMVWREQDAEDVLLSRWGGDYLILTLPSNQTSSVFANETLSPNPGSASSSGGKLEINVSVIPVYQGPILVTNDQYDPPIPHLQQKTKLSFDLKPVGLTIANNSRIAIRQLAQSLIAFTDGMSSLEAQMEAHDAMRKLVSILYQANQFENEDKEIVIEADNVRDTTDDVTYKLFKILSAATTKGIYETKLSYIEEELSDLLNVKFANSDKLDNQPGAALVIFGNAEVNTVHIYIKDGEAGFTPVYAEPFVPLEVTSQIMRNLQEIMVRPDRRKYSTGLIPCLSPYTFHDKKSATQYQLLPTFWLSENFYLRLTSSEDKEIYLKHTLMSTASTLFQIETPDQFVQRVDAMLLSAELHLNPDAANVLQRYLKNKQRIHAAPISSKKGLEEFNKKVFDTVNVKMNEEYYDAVIIPLISDLNAYIATLHDMDTGKSLIIAQRDKLTTLINNVASAPKNRDVESEEFNRLCKVLIKQMNETKEKTDRNVRQHLNLKLRAIQAAANRGRILEMALEDLQKELDDSAPATNTYMGFHSQTIRNGNLLEKMMVCQAAFKQCVEKDFFIFKKNFRRGQDPRSKNENMKTIIKETEASIAAMATHFSAMQKLDAAIVAMPRSVDAQIRELAKVMVQYSLPTIDEIYERIVVIQYDQAEIEKKFDDYSFAVKGMAEIPPQYHSLLAQELDWRTKLKLVQCVKMKDMVLNNEFGDPSEISKHNQALNRSTYSEKDKLLQDKEHSVISNLFAMLNSELDGGGFDVGGDFFLGHEEIPDFDLFVRIWVTENKSLLKAFSPQFIATKILQRANIEGPQMVAPETEEPQNESSDSELKKFKRPEIKWSTTKSTFANALNAIADSYHKQFVRPRPEEYPDWAVDIANKLIEIDPSKNSSMTANNYALSWKENRDGVECTTQLYKLSLKSADGRPRPFVPSMTVEAWPTGPSQIYHERAKYKYHSSLSALNMMAHRKYEGLPICLDEIRRRIEGDSPPWSQHSPYFSLSSVATAFNIIANEAGQPLLVFQGHNTVNVDDRDNFPKDLLYSDTACISFRFKDDYPEESRTSKRHSPPKDYKHSVIIIYVGSSFRMYDPRRYHWEEQQKILPLQNYPQPESPLGNDSKTDTREEQSIPVDLGPIPIIVGEHWQVEQKTLPLLSDPQPASPLGNDSKTDIREEQHIPVNLGPIPIIVGENDGIPLLGRLMSQAIEDAMNRFAVNGERVFDAVVFNENVKVRKNN